MCDWSKLKSNNPDIHRILENAAKYSVALALGLVEKKDQKKDNRDEFKKFTDTARALVGGILESVRDITIQGVTEALKQTGPLFEAIMALSGIEALIAEIVKGAEEELNKADLIFTQVAESIQGDPMSKKNSQNQHPNNQETTQKLYGDFVKQLKSTKLTRDGKGNWSLLSCK